MNNDQLTQAFIGAGFDTPEKVDALLQMAGAQMRRNALLIRRDALTNEQSVALAEIETRRQSMTAAIQAEENAIIAAAAAQAPTP